MQTQNMWGIFTVQMQKKEVLFSLFFFFLTHSTKVCRWMNLLKWLFRVWRGRCLGSELCDFSSITTWDMRSSVGRQSGCATTTTTTTTTRVLTLSNNGLKVATPVSLFPSASKWPHLCHCSHRPQSGHTCVTVPISLKVATPVSLFLSAMRQAKKWLLLK